MDDHFDRCREYLIQFIDCWREPVQLVEHREQFATLNEIQFAIKWMLPTALCISDLPFFEVMKVTRVEFDKQELLLKMPIKIMYYRDTTISKVDRFPNGHDIVVSLILALLRNN